MWEVKAQNYEDGGYGYVVSEHETKQEAEKGLEEAKIKGLYDAHIESVD